MEEEGEGHSGGGIGRVVPPFSGMPRKAQALSWEWTPISRLHHILEVSTRCEPLWAGGKREGMGEGGRGCPKLLLSRYVPLKLWNCVDENQLFLVCLESKVGGLEIIASNPH